MSNYVRGIDHGKAKLTEEQVLLARAMRLEGIKLDAIRATLGVNSHRTIENAVSRRSWDHVPWWRLWTDFYGKGRSV